MQEKWIEQVDKWLKSIVIDLNLCPFARKPWKLGLVRYSISESTSVGGILDAAKAELELLVKSPKNEIATTLFIVPHLGDFENFLDSLEVLEDLVDDMGIRGTIQIASFHPSYQFAGTNAEDQENYTNRAPSPIYHFIREEEISEIAEKENINLEAIPERNQKLMRSLTKEELQRLWESFS